MEPKGSFLERICPMKKKSGPGVDERGGGGVLDSCVRQVIRPLRIFQFLMVILIFALITYTINIASRDLSSIMCILILILSGVYVFVLTLDIICQFGGGEMRTLPMFIFSLLGTIFFACAGIMLLFTYTSPWAIVTIACLSLVTFILFVIDVTLILAFWKRSCNLCQQCCYANRTEILYQATGDCDPACTETVKYDLMTSVSSVRVPSGDEQTTPDHSMRKVNFGHRRQYVDCKTSARTLANTGVRDVQTEKRPMTDVESQTPREVKEMPVQTISRCEMCNRKINLSSKSSGMIPAAHQACAPCPALVQLFRGTPCSPGCNVTGIIQVSQQNQQAQTHQQREVRSKPKSKEPNSWGQPGEQNDCDTLPSEPDSPKITEVSGTITKVTLASYAVPPKRSSTSSQTGEAEKPIKKDDESEESKRSRASQKRKEARKKHEVLIPEKDKKEATAERTEPASNDRKLHSAKNTKVTRSPRTQSNVVKEEAKKNSERKEVVPNPSPTSEGNPNKKENREENKERNKKENEAAAKESKERLGFSNDESEMTISLSGHSISSMQLGTIESKRLIHPTKQVAEMMDRLQEIEGGKMDSFASDVKKPSEVPAVLPSEKKMDLHERKSTASTADNARRIKDTRSVVTVPSAEKRRPRVSISVGSAKGEQLSDSEVSVASNDESELSIVEAVEKEVAEKPKEKHKATVERLPEIPEAKPEVAEEGPEVWPGIDVQPLPTATRSKRTYGFRRKNKIEPSDVSHDTDIQPLDANAACCAEKPVEEEEEEEEKLLAEERDTFDEKGANMCPVCKKIQLPVPSSYQYCNVYRDKRGRIYCEHCATPNTVKVHYKKEHDQKRLKCCACGNFLRIRSHHSIWIRSENCPHCGQTQAPMHTESPVMA